MTTGLGALAEIDRFVRFDTLTASKLTASKLTTGRLTTGRLTAG
jgi:hypothetical protein